MRVITKEMLEERRNENDVLSVILNTPKPDFSELEKICNEFEVSMLKEHEKDRKKIAEALSK